MYDNGNEDDHLEVLAPFIADGSVIVREWPHFPGQKLAFNDFIERHRDDARWVAFIDCDEFLFSPTGKPLPEVLRRYEQYPAVGVNRTLSSKEPLIVVPVTLQVPSRFPKRSPASVPSAVSPLSVIVLPTSEKVVTPSPEMPLPRLSRMSM